MSIFTNPASSSREDAAAYTAALLGLLGSQDPVAVLEQTPGVLRELIAGVDAEHLARPEAVGKWSVRQVLAHLADAELVGGWRYRMILAHDRPQIQGYDQDAWANSMWYDEVEPAASLETFGALRRANLRLIQRATPAELRRVGVHAERGEESIEHLVKLYAAHDLLHRNQVTRILSGIAAPAR
jgi:uncharacterized damage-inducible protein DinB